jgi:hypothetical protein
MPGGPAEARLVDALAAGAALPWADGCASALGAAADDELTAAALAGGGDGAASASDGASR